MAHLADLDLADLVSGTLYELGRMRFQQIAQELQEYEVMSKWLKRDRVLEDSGIGIQRTLMVTTAGAARHVGLYEVDDTDQKDLLTQLNIPWRHAETYWIFDRREVLMNSGKQLVLNIIKPRRAGAMIDLAEELEAKAWSCPGASDNVLPYGLPYWIVPSSTAAFGFNGVAPYGHTTVGGVNPTTYPKFCNATVQYSAVTKADLIKKLRKMHRKVGWKSPVTIQDYRRGSGSKRRLYVDDVVIAKMEDLGEAQNENLGRDLASMDGQMTFRRHPIIWTPQIDPGNHSITDHDGTAVYNPVFFVDHSVFFPYVLKGDFLRETKPEKASDQHNVYETFVDLTYNYLCVDRRRCGVAHSTSALS